jgi:hypothetical protein
MTRLLPTIALRDGGHTHALKRSSSPFRGKKQKPQKKGFKMKNTIEKTKEEIRNDFIIPTPNHLQLVLRIQGRPVDTDYPEFYEDFEPVFELWTNGSVFYWKYENQKIGKEYFYTEQDALDRFPNKASYLWSLV